jgi:acetyl-CoA carboxylase carboxyltransferase component
MALPTVFPFQASNLNLRGEQFKANKDAWSPLIERFEDALKSTTVEGNTKALQTHQNRGQILRRPTSATTETKYSAHHVTARDRIALLLDPESPFLELCSFAGFELPDSSPCASLIVGVGSVRYV